MILDCIYINLSDQVDRRLSLEENFNQNNQAGWRLHRLNAYSQNDMNEKGVIGAISLSEKACYFSHIEALKLSLTMPGPVLIMEDDVQIGSQTQKNWDILFDELSSKSWDLMYGDMTITDVHAMIELFQLRQTLHHSGKLGLLNLGQLPTFSGAMSYWVNDLSKQKVLDMMTQSSTFNLPFDIALRQMIWEKKLLAYIAFPMITSSNNLAKKSLIQDDAKNITEIVCQAFRQMIWFESNYDDIQEDLTQLDAQVISREFHDFSRLLRIVLSPNYIYK